MIPNILAIIVSGIAAVATLELTQTTDFKVSEPITCKSVKGFRNYEQLDPPELTTFDKLLVYVEVSGFATFDDENQRKARLIQNGKVRAKGSKSVIFERKELLSFEPVSKTGRETFYFASTIGFTDFTPGEYVLELETVDKAALPERKVTQSIEFRIIPSPDDAPGSDRKKSPKRKGRD